jgi:hypothetical protein
MGITANTLDLDARERLGTPQKTPDDFLAVYPEGYENKMKAGADRNQASGIVSKFGWIELECASSFLHKITPQYTDSLFVCLSIYQTWEAYGSLILFLALSERRGEEACL